MRKSPFFPLTDTRRGALHAHHVPQISLDTAELILYCVFMRVCGQEFTPETLVKIQDTAGVDGMTRTRLSKRVCELLNWYHRDGRPKEMNCRKALVELERR